ncbi:MAG: hypothetical protein QGG54_02165 [Gammaproteobacteria bacterium]|jgi:hypothetical protein|nr:hypothetical protein [Gammaproteobacteria bacterium]MDP6673849.1 hypothetical protein [Gammaproteobacteria bacterium]
MQTWLNGWCDLVYYDQIPGYKACGWLVRKRLDHAAFVALFHSARFRCAVLLLIAIQIIVLSLAWQWDLAGWRRDLFRAAPALVVLPWLATARKIVLGALLGDVGWLNRAKAHRQYGR